MILHHFDIAPRAEDDILLTIDVDDLVVGAAGRSRGDALEGCIFGKREVGSGFRLGVGLE